MPQPTDEPQPASTPRDRRHIAAAIAAGALVIIAGGFLLVHHAEGRVNHTPMAEARPVTVVAARRGAFRDSRTYVGTVAAWQEANVGPQYISAYVTNVTVRPGATVTRDEVLATLDCSHPNAQSRAAQAAARAVSEHQKATADEAQRENTLLDGGFIAANEVELKTAQSTAEQAQLLQTEAQYQAASQNVGDCALKAPFDGEIGTRNVDPGAFVTPGANIVSVVDRSVVRVVIDAPEQDFDLIAPGTPVRIDMLATAAQVEAKISRRAPKADPKTRTVHVEIDIPDPKRELPTDTTAVVTVDVGKSLAATAVPLYAATEQAGKAKLFVVAGGVAHQKQLAILGESGGSIFFDPKQLAADTAVVTEGRALLTDGDRVDAKSDQPPPQGSAGSDARGGGYGGPM
ncbi:MAG TPA: efflux RND transporter periplasmic adaptor subunit [Kofleriaceae bacterium]|jgi:RND family efflux transporter MFP subunit|nr:efflux RND transporter periplasmic adaptor subunit [Kofleriaceae bacterium]